ncbi:hypothetical protein CW748_10475 [Alteromonadales bacterium alter-6D02]|nr:hypothetical protein CW748_10475 [Alteromonadales bacterium alter-6D02]
MPTEKAKPKLKLATLTVNAPISGEAILLTEHHCPLISHQLLGHGIAIRPVGSRVTAPCRAIVKHIAPTGHHLTLLTEHNVVIDIYIGDNAISTHGVGFTVKVVSGQQVIQGQELINLDLLKLKQSLPSVDVAVLISKGALKLTPLLGTKRAGEDPLLQLIVKKSDT